MTSTCETPVADERSVRLAADILGTERTALMMAFRFLDAALWRMPFEPRGVSRALATEGRALYFSPEKVMAAFRDEEGELLRDYLHSIMHCVFRHPFDGNHENTAAWWIACDAVVEAVCLEACGQRFPSARDADARAVLDELREKVGTLTPFKLYALFASLAPGMAENPETGMSSALEHRAYEALTRDAHDLWRRTPGDGKPERSAEEQPVEDAQKLQPNEEMMMLSAASGSNDEDSEKQPGSAGGQGSDAADAGEGGEEEGSSEEGADSEAPDSAEDTPGDEAQGDALADADDSAATDGTAGEGEGPQPNDDVPAPPLPQSAEDVQAQQDWERLAKRIETDLQTFSAQWGSGMGELMANLAIANRKQVDYAAFLKRFATMGEDLRVNDDEFDYIYYTYGLAHYGNIPLVEPLEYKEDNRVREFVVALDTSGSCAGDLVKKFVTRTYEILAESGSFGDELNIHIIEADNRIQSDTKIRSLSELDRFRNDFKVKGFGGTDFRPVFDYVNQLVEQGEFSNLRGLVYFTDGLGTYPASPPEYNTAFVFVDDEGQRRSCPPWACKAVISSEDIRQI